MRRAAKAAVANGMMTEILSVDALFDMQGILAVVVSAKLLLVQESALQAAQQLSFLHVHDVVRILSLAKMGKLIFILDDSHRVSSCN